MNQKRASQSRFSPAEEQKRLLAHTFGCCRDVYTWAVRQRTDAYDQRGEPLSYQATAERLVLLKKQQETAWLNEGSSAALHHSLRHLAPAFRTFFEGRANAPPFTKKGHRQAAPSARKALSWDGHSLTLAHPASPWRRGRLLFPVSGILPCLKVRSPLASPCSKMKQTAILSPSCQKRTASPRTSRLRCQGWMWA